jgi:DNA-binding NtrC family response regulator
MEPNAGLRAVLASILKKRGYRVLAAPAPADALEMAQIQGPPDLLISEPAPDMLKHLSAQYPALRTLLLNGHSDHAGLPALTKPFELETLLGKVRESLR